MSARDLQAAIILFDTCVTTLNGDFSPNRFEAQRIAVDEIAQAILNGNRESVVGFGTLSGSCQVMLGLGGNIRRFRQYLDSVGRSGTVVEFERSVRAAVFALRRRVSTINFARLITIFSSPHDFTPDRAAVLAETVQRAGIHADVVIFGPDIPDPELFATFVHQVGGGSTLIQIPRASCLSDTIRNRLFGGTDTEEVDQMMAQALERSRLEAGLPNPQDGDLEAALAASREDLNPELDPELAAAIAASLEGAAAGEEQIDENDPGLLEAIQASLEEPAGEAGGGEDQNGDEAASSEEEEGEGYSRARELSLQESEDHPPDGGAIPVETQPQASANEQLVTEEDEDDAELKEALALSMESGAAEPRPPPDEKLLELLDNPDELKKLLRTLPGVDPDDPRFDPKNQKRGGGDGQAPKPS